VSLCDIGISGWKVFVHVRLECSLVKDISINILPSIRDHLNWKCHCAAEEAPVDDDDYDDEKREQHKGPW